MKFKILLYTLIVIVIYCLLMFYLVSISIVSAKPAIHIVESGDTLWDISMIYGISVDELVYINDIGNPDLLQPGQVIMLHSDGSDAVSYAFAQIGKPYVYGGNGPYGYDCSGLVQQAYLHVGMRLPRTADTQYGVTERIDKPERGDLVFYSLEPGGSITHVALAISETMIVHAYGVAGKVETRAIHSLVHIVGYGRVT